MEIDRIKNGDIIITVECTVNWRTEDYKAMCFSFYKMINVNPSYGDRNTKLAVVDSIIIDGDWEKDIVLDIDEISRNDIINLTEIVENINKRRRVEDIFTTKTFGLHIKDSIANHLWIRLMKNVRREDYIQAIDEMIGINKQQKRVIFRNKKKEA